MHLLIWAEEYLCSGDGATNEAQSSVVVKAWGRQEQGKTTGNHQSVEPGKNTDHLLRPTEMGKVSEKLSFPSFCTFT